MELPPGFSPLRSASKSILGKEVVLLHAFGATERTTLNTLEEAKTAFIRGWHYYKFA